jgi:aspartate aminotransferase
VYDSLPTHPEDKILRIMQLYRDDPRAEKIDLGVGVYKNAAGLTPIMQSVKAAEKRLWETEDTKSYVGLLGAPDFSDAMAGLVLGNAVPRENIACAATPGGTGAVRQAFEMIQMVSPDAVVWVSDPSWGNHVSILNYLGISNSNYRYFEFSTGELDFEGMLEDLNGAKPGDVVLLHGCCHNPTGVNLTKGQWQKVSDMMVKNGLIPMVDIAYQGFGNGLDEDAFGVRLVASTCPETLIAASCSKNFGVYRERTGIFMGVSQDAGKVGLLQANMAYLNRQNFSFPPDHGARLVTMVLNDPQLRADWEAELEEVRSGMLDLRQQLAAELQRQTNSNRFGFITDHNGMFSMLGLSEEQVGKLRDDHGVYAVGDSRINIAGLSKDTVPILAKAIASVL